MSMIIRNFVWFLMMGIFPASVPGCFWDEGVCSFGFWEETLFSFLEKRRHHGPWSSNCVSLLSRLQTDLISKLHKQSLQWWFRRIRLQSCVGSVCVGDTTLMCHGRDVHDWVRQPSRRVSFYTSLDGGGLRPSGPSSGNNGSVQVYIRVIRTLYT